MKIYVVYAEQKSEDGLEYVDEGMSPKEILNSWGTVEEAVLFCQKFKGAENLNLKYQVVYLL